MVLVGVGGNVVVVVGLGVVGWLSVVRLEVSVFGIELGSLCFLFFDGELEFELFVLCFEDI